MFNERIIKIANKHTVITNDNPLPRHISANIKTACVITLFLGFVLYEEQ